MSCIILGGGVSGLAAAFYLRYFGYTSKIIVIESLNRLGGWINSERSPNGNLFECGPRTLRVAGNAGANTIQLAEWLGLEDKINAIPLGNPAAKNRMIKVNGKLHLLPNSPSSVMKTLPPFSKPLVVQILKEILIPKNLSNDESIYSFAERRFGTEVADYLVDPLCRGIYAGSARDLSVTAISKRLQDLERRNGSVVKGALFDRKSKEKRDLSLNCRLNKMASLGKWVAWSLKGGLETLVTSLVSYLQDNNVELITNETVKELREDSNERLVITTDKNEYLADRVISCLPANCLKEVVGPWNSDLSGLLGSIPFVDVAVVNLEYSGNLVTQPGFGYLVPSREQSKVLGVIYDSCLFPVKGKTLFTVMMGGSWYQKYFSDRADPDEFLSTACSEINTTFQLNAKPDYHKVSILRKCIPQYTVGHSERVSNAKKLLNNTSLFLSGNSFDGVGINDSIYNAKKLVLSNFDL